MSLLYCYFLWNNKEINIFIIFYQQKLKEEDFKCFGGKLIQKLKEKLKELDSSLSTQSRLSAYPC